MNIKPETTCISGVKDGKENKKGFELMGKRGKIGMKVSKKC